VDSISNLMKTQLNNMLSVKSKLIMDGKWTAEKLASVCQSIDEVSSTEISNRKDSVLIELKSNHYNDFNNLDIPLYSKIHNAIAESYSIHNKGFSPTLMTNISLLPMGNKAVLYI